MQENQTKFIGPRKIINVEFDEAIKTPQGSEVFKVTFDGGYSEIFPKKALSVLMTDKPIDFSQLRDLKFKYLLPELLSVVAEYDLKNQEVKHLCMSLADELENSWMRATNFLWTKDDGQFVPNSEVLSNRSLLEAEKILKTIPVKQNEPTAEEQKAA